MIDWLKKRSRLYWYDQYAMNDQETAFAQYDPDRVVDDLLGTGADIVAVYAANQFSVTYYPSKIWPQHPNLKGRDYFGEVSSRLMERGVKVVAYINWLESRHPEWYGVPLGQEKKVYQAELPLASWADPSDPDKRVQSIPGGQWRSSCLNSPRRQQVVEITREIMEMYRPDLFHMDMYHDGSVCVCDHCRPHLEKMCGTRNITREAVSDHWHEYVEWRNEVTSSLISEMSAIVREHGGLTAHNVFAPAFLSAMSGQTEAWLPSLDVFLSECFDAFLNSYSDLNSTSVNVRWQHAVGKPSWIVRTSTPQHYSHYPLTEAQWMVYAAACKANGCHAFGPCGIGARPDTISSTKLLKRVKMAFDFFVEDSDLHDEAVSAAKVGLVFSWATRNRAGMDDMTWCEEFHGWATLLIEEHLPYDVVVAESIQSASDLSQYDLIILPDTTCLSADFCDAATDYVRCGGRLLSTARSSLYDEHGDARADFALSEVLGVSRRGSVEGPFALERPEEAEPAYGVFQQIEASGQELCRRVEVDPSGSVCGMLDPIPVKPSDWLVTASAKFGDGNSAYIAFDIGRYYQKYGDQHIAQFIMETVDHVLPARQILVDGPRTVEVTLWRQESPERTIVHLANRSVAHTLPTNSRQFTEILPVHDFIVKLESPYAHPKVTCRGADVHSHVDSAGLSVTVAKLGAYAAIVIEPSPFS